MRNSIFKKYFLMISAVILTSIFCLGAVLLLISSRDARVNSEKQMLNIFKDYAYSANEVLQNSTLDDLE